MSAVQELYTPTSITSDMDSFRERFALNFEL